MDQKDMVNLMDQAKSYHNDGLVISPILLLRDKTTNKKIPHFLYKFSELNDPSWDTFKKLCRAYKARYGYFNALACHVDKTRNLLVVDCDSQKAIDLITRLLPPAFKTLRVTTPSNHGMHFWFSTNKQVPFHQNRLLEYDVTRLAFLPGSRVEGNTTTFYEWAGELISPPPIPVALEAYLEKMATGIKELDKPAVQGSGASIIDLECSRAVPGTRHKVLCTIAGKLKSPAYDFSRDETMRYVLRLNSRADFQKPTTEIYQLVNWIYDH